MAPTTRPGGHAGEFDMGNSRPQGEPKIRPRRRDYEKILAALETRWKRHPADRGQMMQQIVDRLWEAFGGGACSWCGFYIVGPEGRELVLGPHRDRPACSPIGTHGVCGHAVETRQTQIIVDVRTLGEAHVVCDPADRSEIAVPIVGADGAVFAVLDLDSRQVGAFDVEDRRWLERIVKPISHAQPPV